MTNGKSEQRGDDEATKPGNPGIPNASGDDPNATRVSETSRKATGPGPPTDPGPATGGPTQPGAAPVFAAGVKLLSRYSLKKLLGRGGFGAVWLAHDEELRMDVAIKFLSELIISNPDAVEDLKRETRYSLRLTHPNIVRTYGFLQSEEIVGIAMEYVSGGTLVHLRAGRPQRCFGPTELAPWITQLCDALDYAHHKVHIVHRDLKPANLMIDDSRDLKVADFGISRSVSDSRTRMTNDRDTSGTLAYMSPQQMMGDPAHVTDDVYSLGATLYDLVTGKPPFYTGDIVQQVWRATPPSVAARRQDLGETGEALPPDWEDVLRACLEKEPGNRPASAGEVAERLGLRSASATRTTAGMTRGGTMEDSGATRILPTEQDLMATRAVDPGSLPAGAPGTRSAPAAGTRPGVAVQTPAPEKKKLSLPILIGGSVLVLAVATGAFLTFRPKAASPPPPPDPNNTVASQPPEVEPLFTGQDDGGSTSSTGASSAVDPPAGESKPPASGNPDAARMATLRREVAEALDRKQLDAAARGVAELLKLSPDDADARAQRQLIRDWQAKESRITRLRQTIPAGIGAKEFSKVEGEIAELLKLAPGDAAALRWREEVLRSRDSGSGVTTPSPVDPPKPDPPKESSPPPVESSGVADRGRIENVIGGYERALESLNIDQYAKLWEGLPGDEKKRLAQFFADLKSMTVDIRVASVDVTGETAAASIHEKRTLIFKAGKDQEVQWDVTLRFKKSGDHWVIVKRDIRK